MRVVHCNSAWHAVGSFKVAILYMYACIRTTGALGAGAPPIECPHVKGHATLLVQPCQ